MNGYVTKLRTDLLIENNCFPNNHIIPLGYKEFAIIATSQANAYDSYNVFLVTQITYVYNPFRGSTHHFHLVKYFQHICCYGCSQSQVQSSDKQ